MNLIGKIKFSMKSAEDIENEWKKLINAKTKFELQQQEFHKEMDKLKQQKLENDIRYNEINSEKKRISDNWVDIRKQWDILLKNNPEAYQQFHQEIHAALDHQTHEETSDYRIDPEVIDEIHKKEFKRVYTKEGSILYERVDHPNLHGHEE